MKLFFLFTIFILIAFSRAYDESDCVFYRHMKPVENLNFLVCTIGLPLPPHIQTVDRFRNEPIKGLLIANSSQIADDSTFGIFNAVTYYGLLFHQIEHITKESLDYLTFLEGLDVSKGTLMKVDFDAFQDFVNLRDLDLSVNRIEYLHPQIFTSLILLEKVNLKENRLMAVESEMFLSNPKLSLLNLQQNRIAYIHARAFDSNRELRELYLAGNVCIDVDFKQPRVQALRFTFSQQCKETPDIINELSDKKNEAESINYVDERDEGRSSEDN